MDDTNGAPTDSDSSYADDPNTIQVPDTYISGHEESDTERQLDQEYQSDEAQEAANMVESHAIGEVVDSTPFGIALHTATMSSDRNEQADHDWAAAQQSQLVDADTNYEIQAQIDQQRDQQNEDSLLQHTPAYDGEAWQEREGDQEPFQP